MLGGYKSAAANVEANMKAMDARSKMEGGDGHLYAAN